VLRGIKSLKVQIPQGAKLEEGFAPEGFDPPRQLV